MIWAWVCERVIGLWMGKAAGLDFLSLPMVKGGEWIMRYSRYLCLPIQLLELCFDKFQHAFLLFRISTYRIQYCFCFG